MPHYKNFAQCVGQLLKEHQLTASALGAQIVLVRIFRPRAAQQPQQRTAGKFM